MTSRTPAGAAAPHAADAARAPHTNDTPGARRISEIVKAVKEYSFMDQAPVQRLDVRAGLDNTLVILRPKLKAGIRVERDYERIFRTIATVDEQAVDQRDQAGLHARDCALVRR